VSSKRNLTVVSFPLLPDLSRPFSEHVWQELLCVRQVSSRHRFQTSDSRIPARGLIPFPSFTPAAARVRGGQRQPAWADAANIGEMSHRSQPLKGSGPGMRHPNALFPTNTSRNIRPKKKNNKEKEKGQRKHTLAFSIGQLHNCAVSRVRASTTRKETG
jgi:hypothetical protein